MIIRLPRAAEREMSPLERFLVATQDDVIAYELALAAIVLGEVKDAGESGAYDPPDLSQLVRDLGQRAGAAFCLITGRLVAHTAGSG